MSSELNPLQPSFARGTEGVAPSNVVRLMHDTKTDRLIEENDFEKYPQMTEMAEGKALSISLLDRVIDTGKRLFGRERPVIKVDSAAIDHLISVYLDQKQKEDPEFMSKWANIPTLAD